MNERPPSGPALALTLLGVAAIDTTRPGSADRQLAHLVIGMALAFAVAVPDYRKLRRFTWPLAILSVLLLVFPEALVGIFSDDPEIITTGTSG